jgi:hypothetical protein
MGMKSRKRSVNTFMTNCDQMIDVDIPGWQELPGSGFICQYFVKGLHEQKMINIKISHEVTIRAMATYIRFRYIPSPC